MLGGGEPGGGVSVVERSGDAAAGSSGANYEGGREEIAAASTIFGSTSKNNNSSDLGDKGRVDNGGSSFGGNRWPTQETLALLKIRSDMDVDFRDASVKGPLWEEVSRKLAELGCHRSAKKCREKFENVYKYHKRTKDGRAGNQEGKTYRFFDQLEAFENHHSISSSQAAPPQVVPTTAMQESSRDPPRLTLPSFSQIDATATLIPPTNPTIQPQLLQMGNPTNPPKTFSHNISVDLMSNSTSSSTSSDVELGGQQNRKRKWKDFFERLMREVIEKQEQMQKRLLEAIEKKEHDRIAREEAWRMHEMARINREREILAQERSISATKDAAVIAFLQKLTDQQNTGQPVQNLLPMVPPPSQQPLAPPHPQPTQASVAIAPVPVAAPPPATINLDILNFNDGRQNYQNSAGVSSSRWPKVEVEALIKTRTSLDAKYQENGPKGPLWEEVSTAMKKIGYNRSSKRCKEKWENINKYFKKVKESNKKRPEDSKTCPYFHQLDALYREKNKLDDSNNQINPENLAPLMVRPEQQWPPPPSSEPENQRHDSGMEEIESEHEDDKDDDDEEEDEGGD
ncbi:hypothetical protein SLA2020_352380 [Shorea laevis]